MPTNEKTTLCGIDIVTLAEFAELDFESFIPSPKCEACRKVVSVGLE